MVQATINPTDRLTAVVNRQVANCMVLYMKLHNYHWFVKGAQFYTLHAKFEELYNEMTAHMDALAERVLTIGGRPTADLKSCLEQASVREASGAETTEEMVRTLHADFETVVQELAQGMEEAEKVGDESTSDLLLGIRASLEKHRWMLQSYLG